MSNKGLRVWLDELERIHRNLKKTPNRSRSRQAVENKLHEINEIWTEFQKARDSLIHKFPRLIVDKQFLEQAVEAKNIKDKAVEIVTNSLRKEVEEENIQLL